MLSAERVEVSARSSNLTVGSGVSIANFTPPRVGHLLVDRLDGLPSGDRPVGGVGQHGLRFVQGRHPRRVAGVEPLGDHLCHVLRLHRLRLIAHLRPAFRVAIKQVLARGRRALLCYGMTGLFHGTGMTGAIERQTGQRIYVIADLVPLAGDPGGLAKRLSRYPRDTVIPPLAPGWVHSTQGCLWQKPAPGARTPSAECGWDH